MVVGPCRGVWSDRDVCSEVCGIVSTSPLTLGLVGATLELEVEIVGLGEHRILPWSVGSGWLVQLVGWPDGSLKTGQSVHLSLDAVKRRGKVCALRSTSTVTLV